MMPLTLKCSRNFLILLGILSLAGCAQHSAIQRVYYNSWEQDIGYAQVLKQGNRLYISGLASDAKTFDEQLQAIYAEANKILADNHLDSSAIVKETIYTTDMEALKKSIPLRKSIFYSKGEYPAASWVQVSRLFMPSQQIESGARGLDKTLTTDKFCLSLQKRTHSCSEFYNRPLMEALQYLR